MIRHDRLLSLVFLAATLPICRPLARAADGAQSWINLLPLVSPEKDSVRGTWTLEGGQLSCTSGGETRIEIPYAPPEQYAFRVVFEVKSGHSDVHQFLSRSGRQWTYVMDWHGSGAFHQDMLNEQRTDKQYRSLQGGVKHTSIVQVLNDSVKTFLDDVLVMECKTDFKQARCWEGRKLRNTDCLGVGANGCAVTFYEIQVLETTGKGTVKRAPDVAVTTSSRPPVPGGEQGPPKDGVPLSVQVVQRVSVPPPDKLREAEATIRDLFKDEFKKTDAVAQRTLAAKLLEQGISTKGDPAARYKLLQMAVEFAVKQGDVAVARQAMEAIAADYDVDGTKYRMKVLDDVGRNARDKDQYHQLAEAYLSLADAAYQNEDFGTAVTAYGAAQRHARSAQDAAMEATATKKSEQASVVRPEFGRVKTAREKLFENPTEGESSLVVGRYLCLRRGDWGKAMPLLANASDQKWAEAAKADLADPQDAADQVLVGDKWYDLAPRLPKTDQDQVKWRARLWYEKTLPTSSGLVRTKIEKRLQELQNVAATGGPSLAAGQGTAFPGQTSEATRRALPTDEELKKFDEIGKDIKNGDRSKSREAHDLRRSLLERLCRDIEKCAPADFKARLDAQDKMNRAYYMGVYGNTATSSSSDHRVADTFSGVAAASKTPNDLLAWLKLGTDCKLERQLRTALHQYITNHPALFPTVETKIKFCDWLKQNGISAPGIEEYKKDLK